MRKIALSLTLAAAAVSTPVLAAESDVTTFKHEGVEYSYAVEDAGDKQIVTGKSSTGAPFRLIVGEKRVSGTYNGQRISFARSEVSPLAPVVVAGR